MFDGYVNVTVGTAQETSPMSSDPPPVGVAAAAPSFDAAGLRNSGTLVTRPRSGTFSSRCRALASAWSASDHCGKPTRAMFSYMASATGTLKCPGQALPSTRDVYVVS